jgi:hypothetical protein
MHRRIFNWLRAKPTSSVAFGETRPSVLNR